MSVTTPPGLAIDSMKIALVLSLIAALDRVEVFRIGPAHLPAEILEGVIELVDRAAVELGRSDELVARLHQRVKDDRLRRVARGDGQRGGRALQRRDPLLQRRRRRVGDAGVDVAERLQAEQRRGVVDVVEDESGRLVDRRDPRAGGRIRPGPRVDRQGGKAGFVVSGHGGSLAVRMVANSGGEGKRQRRRGRATGDCEAHANSAGSRAQRTAPNETRAAAAREDRGRPNGRCDGSSNGRGWLEAEGQVWAVVMRSRHSFRHGPRRLSIKTDIPARYQFAAAGGVAKCNARRRAAHGNSPPV